MKRALRELSNLMSSSKSGERLPGLSLERLEIQTLSDESKRQANSGGSMDSSDEEDVQKKRKQRKEYMLSQSVTERAVEPCHATHFSRNAMQSWKSMKTPKKLTEKDERLPRANQTRMALLPCPIRLNRLEASENWSKVAGERVPSEVERRRIPMRV